MTGDLGDFYLEGTRSEWLRKLLSLLQLGEDVWSYLWLECAGFCLHSDVIVAWSRCFVLAHPGHAVASSDVSDCNHFRVQDDAQAGLGGPGWVLAVRSCFLHPALERKGQGALGSWPQHTGCPRGADTSHVSCVHPGAAGGAPPRAGSPRTSDPRPGSGHAPFSFILSTTARDARYIYAWGQGPGAVT